MSKIALTAAALFAAAMWNSPDAAAQDYGQEYMKAAPSDAKAVAAPATSSAKKKTPKATERCASPGSGTAKRC